MRRPRRPRVPSNPVLQHHYEVLLVKPNVIGCFIGQKQCEGKVTGEVAIVCCVAAKAPSAVLAKDDRIPRRVAWQATSQRRGSLRTDVVEIPQSSAREGVTGPGDGVHFRSKPGSVGMAIVHPFYGTVATTAAHLVVAETFRGEINFPLNDLPRMDLTNAGNGEAFMGRLLRVVMSDAADYALLFPDLQFPARNLFNDDLPFTTTVTLTDAHLGQQMFVATSRGLLSTTFRGLRATIPVGNSVFVNALITDRVTIGGDSGCTLVTANGFIAGLLIGFSGPFSVFMSPRVVLDTERATLAQGELNETPV
jgi:hypothetical protein